MQPLDHAPSGSISPLPRPANGSSSSSSIGLGGERARDLQPPLIAVGQHLDRRPPCRPGRPARAACARRFQVGASPRARRQAGHHHVLEHAHADERPAQLEGARDAEVDDAVGRQSRAVPGPRTGCVAGVGGMKPVSRLYSVVLPAPLGPRMPMISPGCEREADVLHGVQAAEVLGDVDDLEHGAHRKRSDSRRQIGAIRPSGRKNRISIRVSCRSMSRYSPKLRSSSVSSVSRIAPPGGPVDARHAADIDHGDDRDRDHDREQLRAHLQLVVRVQRAAEHRRRRR